MNRPIITEVALNKYLVSATVPDEEPSLIDPQVRTMKVGDQLFAQLKGYLWGERAYIEYVRYPDDWWEAFKERWFPRWLLKRYPVRLTEVVIDVTRLYPHLRYSLPEEKSVLKITKSTVRYQ